MVQREHIFAFANAVADRFHPRQIILFGSYAYGSPTADSDVDLLVVMHHKGHAARQAVAIRQTVRSGFPMDLMVRNPAEIRRRLAMGDAFIREVYDRGIRLYEAPDA